MSLRLSLFATVLGSVACTAAFAQSSFVAPDGRNRYPGVTIFCPSGTGVQPCNFGSGGGGGASGSVSLTQSGAALSASNRLPVSDTALDGLIIGGALSVSGMVGIAGTPTVSLGSGSNPIGSVTVANLPATQPISGTVSLAGTPTVSLGAGTAALGSVIVTNLPATQPVSGTVSLAGLPTVSLGAGTASVGSISVSNFPATQPVSGTVSLAGSPTVSLGAGTASVGSISVSNFPATQPVSGTVNLSAGTAALGSVTVSNLPAIQPVSGAVSLTGTPAVTLGAGSSAIGTVSVTNLPTTQPVTATSLPLPAGAATAAAQQASLGPVAPAAATATNTMVIGCTAATTLPTFTAGQQGAIPCDTLGRPFVVSVPSAANVPSYLQAVSSGGATPVSVINAAGSALPTVVKAGGGMLYGYSVCNNTSAAAFFRMFNQSAAPVVGTSTPILREVVAAGSCARFESAVGFVFSAGIGLDVTTGSLADADTASIASANTITAQVFYK